VKKLAVAPLALLMAALAACSPISSGTITAKVIEPESTIVTQHCAAYNARGICTVWVPQYIHDDEDYRFDIREGDESGYVYVDRTTFDQYDEGDFYG